ncbi:hypothetical protein NC651_028396 [Populus alba x Populus x berolinensis]|nr:hypothetical protein NC651_028396 [Populus alba x Populus x berolinensis]
MTPEGDQMTPVGDQMTPVGDHCGMINRHRLMPLSPASMAHLVSELLELLSSIRFYEVKQEVRLVVGVKEEVKNLTRKLQSVKLEVADAERRWRHEQDESAKEWLDDFEEICYGLDDVLD